MPHNNSLETDIIIVDYEMGNLRSVYNKCKRIGHKPTISGDVEIVSLAKKIILPGVGHFANAISKLKKSGLFDVLNEKVINQKTPILGICLGMQLFTKHSEEGDVKGFGWFDAKTVRFKISDKKLKVPHMGWNSIKEEKRSNLLENVNKDHLFYFVHSYHVVTGKKQEVLTTTDYEYNFVSAIEKDNIFGVQFHPEKSHEWGEQLLSNFLKL